MFRLLRLKPPHGWNAVAWELGIVTLGVLIALGAQQAVESINERREAAATRAAVIQEIEESLALLEMRRIAQPCVDRRLAEIRAIVEQWARTGTFKRPRWISQAPWFVLNNLRVDAAVSAGRLPLLSNEEQYRVGLFYTGQVVEVRSLAVLDRVYVLLVRENDRCAVADLLEYLSPTCRELGFVERRLA